MASLTVQAEVQTDGSLGRAMTFSGDFLIDDALGQRRGNNVFHSFSRFDLDADEFAAFEGAAEHVFARITGDQASQIDGTVLVEGNAQLWLMNPNGLIFSETSNVDVRGGLTLLSGDSIRFSDGHRFYSQLGRQSTLTSAPAASWGLASSAPVVFNGFLITDSQAQVDLIGQQISLENADLSVPNAQLRIVASNQTEVPITAILGDLQPASQGTVEMSNSVLDLSANRGGRLQIRAGRLHVINDSLLRADTQGNAPASGQILLQVDELLLDASSIEVDDLALSTLASTTQTAIDINASEIRLDNGALISSSVFGSGSRGRDIRIDAAEIVIHAGIDGDGNDAITEIAADAFGSGIGGDILVQAGHLELRDGTIAADAFGEDTGGSAVAGSVIIQVDTLSMQGAALISSAARGGASVRGRVQIDARDSISLSATADNFPLISVAERDASQSAEINNSAFALTINSPLLRVRGGLITTATTSDSGAGGDNSGGGIRLELERLDAVDLEISSRTEGAGSAGDIRVHARDFLRLSDSVVSAEAERTDGGNIALTGNNIVLLRNSLVSARADGRGGNLQLGSRAPEQARLLITDGEFEASAISADGGNIRLNSQRIASTPRSRFDASSEFGRNGQIVFSANRSEQPRSSEYLDSSVGQPRRPLRNDCGRRSASRAHSSLRLRGRDCSP